MTSITQSLCINSPPHRSIKVVLFVVSCVCSHLMFDQSAFLFPAKGRIIFLLFIASGWAYSWQRPPQRVPHECETWRQQPSVWRQIYFVSDAFLHGTKQIEFIPCPLQRRKNIFGVSVLSAPYVPQSTEWHAGVGVPPTMILSRSKFPDWLWPHVFSAMVLRWFCKKQMQNCFKWSCMYSEIKIGSKEFPSSVVRCSELGEDDKKSRVLISAWNTFQGRCEFLGCMSFGVRHLLCRKREVSGWYHLLSQSAGIRKHLQVVNNVKTLPGKTRITSVCHSHNWIVWWIWLTFDRRITLQLVLFCRWDQFLRDESNKRNFFGQRGSVPWFNFYLHTFFVSTQSSPKM